MADFVIAPRYFYSRSYDIHQWIALIGSSGSKRRQKENAGIIFSLFFLAAHLDGTKMKDL
jgi:hypothetical protein